MYKIGLYKSKGTQYKECSQLWTTKESGSDNLEKISFSLTVSSETLKSEMESIEVTKEEKKVFLPSNLESQAMMKQLRNKMEQKCPEESWEVSIYDNLSIKSSKAGVNVPEFIGGLMTRSCEQLEKVIPLIRKSVHKRSSVLPSYRKKSETEREETDQIKKIFAEEENAINKEDIINSPTNDTSPRRISQEQINIYSTTDYKAERVQLKKVNNKSEKILSQNDKIITKTKVKNEEKNRYDSTENKKPTVSSVHVHGDFLPLTKADKFLNVLEVSHNGRYVDEANLFCDTVHQRRFPYYTVTDKNIKEYLTEKMNLLDLSTSDIFTLKSLSKGDVKCKCSGSSGELHICKCENYIKSEQRRSKILPKKRKKTALKKRTYFNNWITYFVRNDQDLNDSSWNSSYK